MFDIIKNMLSGTKWLIHTKIFFLINYLVIICQIITNYKNDNIKFDDLIRIT